jgi:hypothetical protein
MDMRQEARKCASIGLRVFPLHEIGAGLICTCKQGATCKNAGKHPRILEWQLNATSDEATVGEWFRRWPRAGLGMATGRASGVWVLDLDGDEAIAWYASKVREHGRTPTRGVRTGRGRHLYFTFPDGVEIRNMQDVDKQKIDVRGDGGFVVLPPTLHYSGRRYEWLDTGVYQQEPAAPPGWLIEYVRHVPPPPPPPRPASVSREGLRRVFNDAIDADPDLRTKLGERAGGRLRANYVDRLRCPSCGRHDAWFYVHGGPAVCHHRNSCGWAGPITRILEIA